MIKFIIGLVIGGVFGMLTMIFAQASKMAENEMVKTPQQDKEDAPA